MKNKIIKIPYILRNKYFLVLLVAIVWVIFFDSDNVIHTLKNKKKLEHLENVKQKYIEKTEDEKSKVEELDRNKEIGERVAREKYYFKKNDEEVFLIKRKEDVQ